MLKQIKATFWFHISDLIAMLVIMAVAAVMGMAVTVLVNLGMEKSGEKEYILLASFMMLLILLAAGFFTGMLSVNNRFNMMISMGRTRKEFFIVYLCVEMLYTLMQLATVWFVVFLEWLMKKFLYEDRTYTFDCSGFLLDFRAIFFILIFLPVLKLLVGALFMKFGFVVWYGMCIGLWLFGILCQTDAVHKAVMNMIKYFTATGCLEWMLLFGAAGIVVICAMAAALTLRKQAVRVK
ncbi:MAG: hypothetical protein ACI4TB_02625 [Lachnospiraceae bacterium]